jgi:hypothetical protein
MVVHGARALIGFGSMNMGGFFGKKIRLPIWPLIPLLMVGLCVPLPTCDPMAGISGIYTSLGFMAVAIRYWWAWIHGAPLFDWLVLIVLTLTMGIWTRLFVSAVAACV